MYRMYDGYSTNSRTRIFSLSPTSVCLCETIAVRLVAVSVSAVCIVAATFAAVRIAAARPVTVEQSLSGLPLVDFVLSLSPLCFRHNMPPSSFMTIQPLRIHSGLPLSTPLSSEKPKPPNMPHRSTKQTQIAVVHCSEPRFPLPSPAILQPRRQTMDRCEPHMEQRSAPLSPFKQT
ncbi:hypothetical protein C7974DRAFT_395878 [Boeremia exigua]|uniref:uncharacterized protein n=1 Tax=Boeremia exigua TaxID=749465 RepID=UPI001E8D4456|nr:uncharacterized protein C7974DRAFT_395878 [Boeremia exigua]KAH6625334.1 hypothetical protein C7974DRAFT_395878 [Boeremia exigua]